MENYSKYLQQELAVNSGWWFVGRTTVEELRLDLRVVISRRPDYAYDRAWDESEEARKEAFL